MVSGKWVAIALTASLAVNIFLAGLFVGRQMGGPPPLMRSMIQRPAWRPGDQGMPPFIERIANSMSPQYRDVFVSTMDKHQAEIKAAGSALREARGKVRQVLGAETFDRAAAEAAVAELRDRNMHFQQSLQAALIDAAQALPLEGRRQMINPERRGQPRP